MNSATDTEPSPAKTTTVSALVTDDPWAVPISRPAAVLSSRTSELTPESSTPSRAAAVVVAVSPVLIHPGGFDGPAARRVQRPRSRGYDATYDLVVVAMTAIPAG